MRDGAEIGGTAVRKGFDPEAVLAASLAMFVLPLIELRSGESVHVLESPGQGEVRPLIDPVEVMNRFSGMGAQGFHVVDIDHSLDPRRNNDKALAEILEHTVMPVQAGGGVRSLKRIQELLDSGVRRVLVGSMGVLHPEWVREAAIIFRDQLVLCVDVREGTLRVKGRTEDAPLSLDAYLQSIDGLGLDALHLAWEGPAAEGLQLAKSLSGRLKTPLTYQGPIASHDELAGLEQAGLQGVVLGPEVYDGRLAFPALAKTYRVR